MGQTKSTPLAKSSPSWSSIGANIATPAPLLGRSSGASRGSQSRWGSTPPTFVSSGRKPMLSRRAPSPLSCCGDTFAGGLHPVSLKRDIKRYIRENQ